MPKSEILLHWSRLITRAFILYSLTAQLYSVLTAASPIASPESASQWFHDQFYPRPGSDTAGEIQCYGLPYGSLGFLSHLLTYYTAMVVGSRRTPLNPWKELKHTPWDIIISIVSIVFAVVMAGFTVSSCRHSWPFVLLAVWKLVLGFLQPVCEISAILGDGSAGVASGFFIYGNAIPIGTVGIFKIVHDTFDENKHVRIITYTLVGLVAVIMVVAMVTGCVSGGLSGTVLTGFGLCCLLFMLYADWILAALVGTGLGRRVQSIRLCIGHISLRSGCQCCHSNESWVLQRRRLGHLREHE